MKGLVASLTVAVVGVSAAFGGGGGGGGGSSPDCTVQIAWGDEVYSPEKPVLSAYARVFGGCSGASVQWSGARSDGAWSSNPFSEYDPDLGSDYSKVAIQGYNTGLSLMQSDDYYYTVTASVGSSSDSIRIIGDSQDLGATDRTAVTVFPGHGGKVETKPWWYFAKRVNDGTCCSDLATYYKDRVDQYANPTPYDWYANGFSRINDHTVFDPYAGVNLYYGYTAIRPPGGGPIYASMPDGAGPARVRSQAASSCDQGDCVSDGGIFLGYQGGFSGAWVYLTYVAADGRNPWQHAAIKTGDGRYTEAPVLGVPVRERPSDVVRNPYYRRLAYLQVNDSRGTLAADWARRQVGKPYSLYPLPKWDQRGDTGADYEGFYCSLLAWAAWYHGASVNVAGSEADRVYYIVPGALWAGATQGKSYVVADFSRN